MVPVEPEVPVEPLLPVPLELATVPDELVPELPTVPELLEAMVPDELLDVAVVDVVLDVAVAELLWLPVLPEEVPLEEVWVPLLPEV